MFEDTFVLFKPDAVQRELVEEIKNKFLKLGGTITMEWDTALIHEDVDGFVDEMYAHVKDQPFFEDMKAYLKSGPIHAVIVSGTDTVSRVRSMIGSAVTPEQGTIRSEYGIGAELQENIIHASESRADAKKEVGLWLKYFGDLS